MQALTDRLVIWACCAVQAMDRPIDTIAVVRCGGYHHQRSMDWHRPVSSRVSRYWQRTHPAFWPVSADGILIGGCSAKTMLAAIAAVVVCFAGLSAGRAAIVVALIAVAWLLRSRFAAVERGQMELKRLRDNSHELAMLLTEKHRELLQKQDYEVRLAMLNERGRIAREIHDHVGHLLSRSILQVGALLATQKDEGTRSALSVIRDTLSQAMDTIRTSIHNLHGKSLDLKTQVEALAQSFTFCPLSVDYRLESEPRKEISHCFIAIIKEGLNNIMRHSDATRATLTLLEHPALYQLVLQDNGTRSSLGSRSALKSEGLGLYSMETVSRHWEGNSMSSTTGDSGCLSQFRRLVPKGERHMRVLVVDDDRLVCEALKTILQTEGDVEVAGVGHNGHDAVSLFAELKPDVLLMDIRMGGMTGLGLSGHTE